MSGLFRYNSTPTRPNTLSPFCVSGQDATMDGSFAFGYRSPSSTANLLPGGNGAGAGSTSPGQGRSLRDYDEKLHVLQKENFNLKLRLFFLEEKTTTNTAGGGGGGTSKASDDETLFKQNVDLKVEIGELRKELQEKQDLLCQAAKAMELMEDTQRKSHEKSSLTITDLSQKIKYLQDELRSFSSQSQTASGTFSGRSMASPEADRASKSIIAELEQVIQQHERKIDELTNELLDTQATLKERDESIEEYERRAEHLERQLIEMQHGPEYTKNSTLEATASDGFGEQKDQSYADKSALADYECTVRDLEEKLAAMTRSYGKGCQTIQLLMIKTSELTDEIEQLKSKPIGSTSPPSAHTAGEINSLKAKLIQAQNDTDQANRWRKECVELCGVLSIRLNELAGFLDSLLNHKDVLSVLAQDRHKAMRKAVDRSLDLSRSLNNMSISAGPVGRFSMVDNSLLQLSSLSEILNDSYFDSSVRERASMGAVDSVKSTLIIDSLRAEVNTLKSKLEKVNADTGASLLEGTSLVRRDRSCRNLSHQFDVNSESEAWSEPDRKVSHERIGLDESVKMNTHVRSPSSKFKEASSSASDDNNDSRSNRKNTVLRLQEKILDLELQLAAKNDQLALLEAKSLCDAEKAVVHSQLSNELDEAHSLITELETRLTELRNRYSEMEKSFDIKLKQNDEVLMRYDSEREQLMDNVKELEQKLADQVDVHAREIVALASEHAAALHSLQQHHAKELHDELKRVKEQNERDYVPSVTYQEKVRRCAELSERLEDMEQLAQLMREEEAELKAQIADKEKSLRAIKRNADDLAMQMSKAVLERTKFMNERDQFEQLSRELQEKCDRFALDKSELHSKLASLAHDNAQLHNKLVLNETQFQLTRSASQGNARYALTTSPKSTSCVAALGSGSGDQSGYTSDELKQRLENSSPDLGIESDGTGRSSGTDGNSSRSPLSKLHASRNDFNTSLANILLEGDEDDNLDRSPSKPLNGHASIKSTSIPMMVQHDCDRVDKENAALRRKLERTRRAFEKTWACLRISNQRKEQIEKDIRQEIYKTHSVLKNVRSNIESVNENAEKNQIHISGAGK